MGSVVLPACGQGLCAATACASALRLQCRFRELAGGLVGAKEGVLLPSYRQGLRTSTASTGTLRLQRRFCELAGGLVGTEEGVVLPAPGQGLRSNAMPHDPVTGCVLGVVLVSVAPTRTPRAPSSGVHVLGVALVSASSSGVKSPRWYPRHLRAPGV